MTNELVRLGQERKERMAEGAAKQWGNVTRRQLLALGFTVGDVRGMAARGQLLRVHQGVYAVGHRSPAPEARWAAAQLFAGRGSVLSHAAAAAVHGLIAPRRG